MLCHSGQRVKQEKAKDFALIYWKRVEFFLNLTFLKFTKHQNNAVNNQDIWLCQVKSHHIEIAIKIASQNKNKTKKLYSVQ